MLKQFCDGWISGLKLNLQLTFRLTMASSLVLGAIALFQTVHLNTAPSSSFLGVKVRIEVAPWSVTLLTASMGS